MKKKTKQLLISTVGAAGLLLASAQAVSANTTAEVHQGDTVWGFAQKNNVSIQSIEALNKISSQTHIIFPGQKLQIPTQQKTAKTAANNQTGTYVVKAGDTLWDIARAHQMSVSQLRKINNLDSKSDLIQIGQVLKVAANVQTNASSVQKPVPAANAASQATANNSASSSTKQAAASSSVGSSSAAKQASAAVSSSAASSSSAVSAASSSAVQSSSSSQAVGSSSASSQNNSAVSSSAAAQTSSTANASSASASSTYTAAGQNSSQAQASYSQQAPAVTTPKAASYSQTQTSSAASTNQTSQSQTSGTVQVKTSDGSVVTIAKKYLGTPYVWGGSSPKGFDCSGFTQYVYGQAGKQIGRTTVAQESAGTQIPVSQAQAGDLLFWGNKGSSYHVAISTGGSGYIASPQPGQNVKYGSTTYYKPTFAVHVK